VLLGRESAPLTFPADRPTHGALATGPILDLNVMVRRGIVRASVERHVVSGTLDLILRPGWTLVLVNHGGALLRHGGSVENLDARDCLLAENGESLLRIEATNVCECYVIRLGSAA
jgi:environmental stress-induced protein Ves